MAGNVHITIEVPRAVRAKLKGTLALRDESIRSWFYRMLQQTLSEQDTQEGQTTEPAKAGE
jgi:hypothetical protein